MPGAGSPRRRSAPPTPAIPAEKAKTDSVATRSLMPSVAQPTWLSLRAMSRRPKSLRRSQATRSTSRANAQALDTRNAWSPVRSMPRSRKRSTARLPPWKRSISLAVEGGVGERDAQGEGERRQLEDPAVEHHRERGRRQGEVEAREAEGGERHQRADQGADEGDGHQHQRAAVAEVGGHDRADGGEAHRARREPSGVADERDEREGHDGEAPHPGDRVEVAGREQRGHRGGRHHHADREGEGARPGGRERQLPDPQRAAAAQPALRQELQGDEQHDDRQHVDQARTGTARRRCRWRRCSPGRSR